MKWDLLFLLVFAGVYAHRHIGKRNMNEICGYTNGTVKRELLLVRELDERNGPVETQEGREEGGMRRNTLATRSPHQKENGAS